MSFAKIPAAYGQAHLITRLPGDQQYLVDLGAERADRWILDNQGLTHEECMLSALRDLKQSSQRPFSDGYLGRIHQRLKSAEAFDPAAVIAAGSEMTQALLEMSRECLSLVKAGHLTADSKAMDYLVRLEALEASITECPASEQGGGHE